MIPRIYGRSYAIEAELHVPEGGAEGVLVAFADFIGGFALWVDENGLLNHTYQFLGVETYKQTSTEPIPTGDVTVKMLFEADEPKPGTGGKVTLLGQRRADRRGPAGPRPSRCSSRPTPAWTSAATTAASSTSPTRTRRPYAFTGTVKKVVFDLKPHAPRGRAGAARAARRQAVAHGAAG